MAVEMKNRHNVECHTEMNCPVLSYSSFPIKFGCPFNKIQFFAAKVSAHDIDQSDDSICSDDNHACADTLLVNE
jgi:hypothetical protein